MVKLKLDENRFRELKDFIVTCIIVDFITEILSWKKTREKRH